MVKTDNKPAQAAARAGQAAVELAVFGAILIFILGSIVQAAVNNGYNQNEGFTAMRMAMLASWEGAKQNAGFGNAQNVSHNSATVLFVEDRLSPDFTKYGPIDRNPYIAQGAGTFSYNLFYPVDESEAGNNVPVMDVYINGQHFTFSTAIFTSATLAPPITCADYAGGSCLQLQCLRNQREWIGGQKLFYTTVVNGAQASSPPFSATPPGSCSGTNSALCSTLTVTDASGQPYTNSSGDLQYDLRRLGDYSSTTGVESQNQFPVAGPMRNAVSWQWAATLASDNSSIGLDPDNDQYPQYDIDGRLKPVTIYSLSTNTNSVSVSYEDFQNGDIDATWDFNTCTPKPGLLPIAQVYTFTQAGTYLEIKEGGLYDPETDSFVRSANKRDTVDLIQRVVQMSNNTGRFCSGGTPNPTIGNDGVTPNPVEVCIYPGDQDNCFSTEPHIKSTCFDETSNRLFVRSRIQDLRGHYWFTDAQGQLQVQ